MDCWVRPGWAFIHVLYLGRAEGQLMLCMQWLSSVILGRTGARYIDTPSIPRSDAVRPATEVKTDEFRATAR